MHVGVFLQGPEAQVFPALIPHARGGVSEQLNLNLLAGYGDVAWYEQTIQARSKEMVAMVTDVWPGPETTVSEDDH